MDLAAIAVIPQRDRDTIGIIIARATIDHGNDDVSGCGTAQNGYIRFIWERFFLFFGVSFASDFVISNYSVSKDLPGYDRKL